MAEILCNPIILLKFQRELNQVITKAKLVQEYDIVNLLYLQAVMKEAFTLHPPLPILVPHMVEKEEEICGFLVHKNAQVFINAWVIRRDPKIGGGAKKGEAPGAAETFGDSPCLIWWINGEFDSISLGLGGEATGTTTSGILDGRNCEIIVSGGYFCCASGGLETNSGRYGVDYGGRNADEESRESGYRGVERDFGDIKEKAHETKEKSKQGAEEITEKAKAQAEETMEMKDKAKEIATSTAEYMSEKAKEKTENAKEAKDIAKEHAKDAARKAAETAEKAKDVAKEHAKVAAQKTAETAKKAKDKTSSGASIAAKKTKETLKDSEEAKKKVEEDVLRDEDVKWRAREQDERKY
ncbi:Cytochrome P450 [Dillenia turbinata]|uniref:Cytochrome P450 n=1 Tax=Dillenia turbinata TaxID=194707 RepID=A0AAN8YZ74_9MAGN